MLRWCCTVFKTGSITSKIDSTFFGKKKILSFQGMRRLESSSRDKYERISEDSKISKQVAILPIIDWQDIDVWLYILSNKIPFNNAYRLGFSRVGCWCCPNNSSWSEFLSSVYMNDEYNKFHNILIDFANKSGKIDVDDYVNNGEWKKRQGGNGINDSKNTFVTYRPCALEENSFNFSLTKPINDFLYTLFIPFGVLDFDTYSRTNDEVYVLSRKTKLPLLKLKGSVGEYNLKVSVLSKTGIFKDIKIIEKYIKYQINKFQLCIGCSGCSQVCKNNAIQIHTDKNGIVSYLIDVNKCIGCLECIKHFQGGCYMNKVLKVRKDSISYNKEHM